MKIEQKVKGKRASAVSGQESTLRSRYGEEKEQETQTYRNSPSHQQNEKAIMHIKWRQLAGMLKGKDVDGLEGEEKKSKRRGSLRKDR